MLGQFLANFWIAALRFSLGRVWWQAKWLLMLFPVTKCAVDFHRSSAVNLGSRNQYAPEAGQLPQHPSPNESADRFFADTHLGGTAFHVEGLACG